MNLRSETKGPLVCGAAIGPLVCGAAIGPLVCGVACGTNPIWPKRVFMTSGGMFHLRYWPQSMLFIILMRFIERYLFAVFTELCLRTLFDLTRLTRLALATAHVCQIQNDGFILCNQNSELRSLWLIRLMNMIPKPTSNGPRKKKKPKLEF